MNDLFYQNLGRKIKELRKNKKLTQEAICGSHLNRSMLSQIENGIARPSVDTLLFLCKQLEIPLSYLMCESKKEEARYKRMQTIEEIRRLYGSGQYFKCAEFCRMEMEGDDEIAIILAQCELMLAGACLERSALAGAAIHIAAAKAAVQDALYGTKEVLTRCSFLQMLMDAVENQHVPAVETILEFASCVEPMFMLYLILLSHMEYDQSIIPPSLSAQLAKEGYRSYIMARIAMQQEEYGRAHQLLRPICYDPPGFFTEFFVLRDMEYCCQKTENYKEAYEFAKKRLSLSEMYAK